MQFKKTLSLSDSIEEGRDIFFKLRQFSKQPLPIEDKDEWSLNLTHDKEVQFKKVLSLSEVTDDGIITLSIRKLKKAFSSICVIDAGIAILFKLEHFSKRLASILVRFNNK